MKCAARKRRISSIDKKGGGCTINRMPGVFLVGFMGAGKSTVGRCLAERLGSRFVDLDAVIEERAGLAVREIFVVHGETGFRHLEHEALTWAAGLAGAVVALGGGAFSDPANRQLIADTKGTSVFLDLPWPAILRRLPGGNHDRPKFSNPEDARRLFDDRQVDYRRADLTVSLNGDEAAAAVAELIKERLAGVSCVI